MIEEITAHAEEVPTAQVEIELVRILQHRFFTRSKRLADFLNFIVRRTLDGHGEDLKERTLGIEVFRRPPTYDTGGDAIVRVTAGELRKRLAQYYQEEEAHCTIRITLPLGSYTPHFIPASRGHNALHPSVDAGEASISVPSPLMGTTLPSEAQGQKRSWFRSATGVISLLLLISALAGGIWVLHERTVLRRFWEPMLRSGRPVLICVSSQGQLPFVLVRDSQHPLVTSEFHRPSATNVVIQDMNPLLNLVNLLNNWHHSYQFKADVNTTFDDFKNMPAVLIGGNNNEWTLTLTRDLPYHFANDADMSHFWIEDKQSKGTKRWQVQQDVTVGRMSYTDYAIIGRFFSKETSSSVMVAAGITQAATKSAAEVLTQNSTFASLSEQLPKGWEKQNFEAIISVQVIAGSPGTPKIEAFTTW